MSTSNPVTTSSSNSSNNTLPFNLSPTLITTRYSSDDKSYHLPIYNPSTDKLLTTLATSSPKEAQSALTASRHAFQKYRHTTPSERASYLLAAADALTPHLDELSTLLSLENGKPVADARMFDLNFAVNAFRWYGSLIDKLPAGEHYDRGAVVVDVVREPIGVVAAILPFNWPPIHTAGKLAPALAMGNTVVLKPGDQAPLTAIRIAEIVAACFPPDVVVVVPGRGPEIPAWLTESPDVGMVSFTGSTPAGKQVARAGAKTLKRVALELGGKNAFVVFDDANLHRAVRDAVEGAFFNKGEACTAASRILVQKGVYDVFVEKMARAVERLKVGDGLDPATHVGPQVSKEQQERVLRYLELAQEEGAVVAAQAKLPEDERSKHGYFVAPTLLKDVKRSMRVAREEMFGALVTVTVFEDEDEAVDIVNESEYGLTCIIYTGDAERAMRCSRRVEAGMVFLNNYRRNVLGIPFGGVKETGGSREHSLQTMLEYSETKTIQQPSGMRKLDEWRVMKDVFDD